MQNLETLKKKRARLISRASLQDRWDCSYTTLIRYEKAGKLEAVKLSPRAVRYRVEQIESIEANESGERVAAAN